MASRTRSRSTLRQRSVEHSVKLSKSNPASRNSSPAPGNRRIAKLNMYLSKSQRGSATNLSGFMEPLAAPSQIREIKRWDGNRRLSAKWDSVRRDPELWFSDGDCLIHFYDHGASRRGPSLRVSLAHLESSDCGPLLDRCYSQPGSPRDSITDSDRSSDMSEHFDISSASGSHELYIPAPSHYTREEALQYHITTRNFFAWLYGTPMVGDSLGQALVSLQERMRQYRSNLDDSQDDVLAYMDDQGYTDFRDCPDHALAILRFAENYRHRELWTDAFVHCTGMNDRLFSSREFEGISRASSALITRAHVEMHLRIERAERSLGNFLEDDLSGAYLGLGKEAQLHLERFRSFLHSYYVAQYSYWPPAPNQEYSDDLPKHIYRSMYFDFRNLYDYLADQRSGIAIEDNRPVDGGICVFQNVMAFDKRNKYASLPHPLSLVPKVPVSLHNRKTFGLSNFFGNKQANFTRRVAASGALTAATNAQNAQVINNGLVREYLRFEKLWTMREDTTVSCADARKVRWILIYAILQTLISVTRVPIEVRDTEGVAYPLCCQIAGTPPWPIQEDAEKKIGQGLPRPTSLREQIIELGPDMDILSAKPGPLIVKRKTSSTSSRRSSFVHRLSLKSPKPIRTPSIEFLGANPGDVSPIDQKDDRSFSVGDVSPIDQKHPLLPEINSIPINISPLGLFETLPDLSTPSTSEAGGSAGWSASSSEDDMEHPSIDGGDSNYGDDEDEEEPRSVTSPPSKAFRPSKRTPSGASIEGRFNPELELFLRS